MTERAKTKKKEEVTSAFNLYNSDKNIAPPGEYDRAVLNYLCTEFLNGNRYITFQMIQRGITGKVGKIELRNDLSQIQSAEIEKSVSKLMSIIYRPQDSVNNAYEKLNYTNLLTKVNIKNL